MHSLTGSCCHWLTQSLTQLLTDLTHSYALILPCVHCSCSFIHPFMQLSSFVHLFIHSFNHSSIHPSVRSFVQSFNRLSMPSCSFIHTLFRAFIYSFVCSVIRLSTAPSIDSSIQLVNQPPMSPFICLHTYPFLHPSSMCPHYTHHLMFYVHGFPSCFGLRIDFSPHLCICKSPSASP